MKTSEAIRWKKRGESEWVRRCTGLERFLWLSEQRFHEANILLNVLVRHKTEEAPHVNDRLRAAWLALYMQVPSLSTTLNKNDDNVIEAKYRQLVRPDEIEHWLSGTFRTHPALQCTTEDDAWAQLDLLREEIANEGISRAEDKGHVGFIDVVPCAKDLTGLIFRLDHGAFDGTGSFMLVDALLKHYIKQTRVDLKASNGVIGKPLPAPSLLSYVNESILDADNSKTLQSLFESRPAQEQLNHLLSPIELLKHATKVTSKRLTFSQEETSKLLQRAREHQVSISQIIVATHLVPMLKLYPIQEDAAEKGKTRIQFTSPINVRPLLSAGGKNEAAKSSFGSEVVLLDYHVAISDITKSLCGGHRVQTKEDIECLLHLAHQVDQKNKDLPRTFESAMSVFNSLGENIPEPKIGEPATDMLNPFIVSDGLLERFVSREYSDALEVLGAHTIVNLQQAFIGLRSITFRDRLTLTANYNEEVWKGVNLSTFLDDWADALRAVLLT